MFCTHRFRTAWDLLPRASFPRLLGRYLRTLIVPALPYALACLTCVTEFQHIAHQPISETQVEKICLPGPATQLKTESPWSDWIGQAFNSKFQEPSSGTGPRLETAAEKKPKSVTNVLLQVRFQRLLHQTIAEALTLQIQWPSSIP